MQLYLTVRPEDTRTASAYPAGLAHAAYRIGEGDGCDADLAFWQSGSALAQQAALGRELGADGFALYRYDSLFRNTGWEELAASEAAALTQLP